MGLLIDILFALTIILCIFSGYKRGFVRSIMNIVTLVAALICGKQFTPALANIYYEKFFMNSMTNDIYNSIYSLISTGLESLNLEQLFADCPPALMEIAQRYQTDVGTLQEYYHTNLAPAAVSETTEALVHSISEYIADPVATAISEVMAFITIFFCVVILLKIVTLILDLIFSIPILNTLNRVAGMLLGILCGVVYVWIFSLVITALMPALSSWNPSLFSASAAESSLLLKWAYQYNLFTVIS